MKIRSQYIDFALVQTFMHGVEKSGGVIVCVTPAKYSKNVFTDVVEIEQYMVIYRVQE